ncbi:MAG: phytanoyl-CoA dioxygenase family protein [Pseudomonadota bacterium]|nr:phytanoyl-CoA dioxygenase family protein [Pseudomonadota bacterium]
MLKLLNSLLKEIVESILRSIKKLSVSSDVRSNYKAEYNGLTGSGFFVIKNWLSKETCNMLIDEIDRHIESDRSNVWADALGADNRLYFIDEINDKFKEFYNTPYFREVLEAYTGIKNPKGMLLAGRIEAIEGNLGSGGGWHRDSPVHHQTKAICYLSDVSENNGPFQYIIGSHSKKSVIKSYLNGIFAPGQFRFTENEIEQYISVTGQQALDMTADAGTLLFADTKGIHRGKPIESGVRYALFCYFWDKRIPKHFETLRQS